MRDESIPSTQAAVQGSYGAGVLTHTGIVFVAPEITEQMERSLRQGLNLDDCYDGTMTVTLSGLTINSRVIDKIAVKILVSDFASAAVRVFLGDRVLKNQGYSALELSGAGGDKQKNDPLDVFRVEQRLKYLGFSSFEKTGGSNLKEFTVDGKWENQEISALRAFYGMTHYTWAAGQQGVKGYGYTGIEPAKTVKPGSSKENDPNDDTNLEW